MPVSRVVSRPLLRAEVLDRYVEFVAARCRAHTVIATVSDLRAFFAVIDKSPLEVTTKDVFEFIAAQRRGRGDGRVVRLSDGEAGLAARTIRRRLAVMSGLFNYLVMCGEISELAPLISRVFQLRSTGASYNEIEVATGIKYSTVRQICHNRAYLGETKLRESGTRASISRSSLQSNSRQLSEATPRVRRSARTFSPVA